MIVDDRPSRDRDQDDRTGLRIIRGSYGVHGRTAIVTASFAPSFAMRAELCGDNGPSVDLLQVQTKSYRGRIVLRA